MIVIKTDDEMQKLLATDLDEDLHTLLEAVKDRLLPNYAFDEQVAIYIIEGGDTLESLKTLAPGIDVDPELITNHSKWTEITLIIDDSGFGYVVFLPNIDTRLYNYFEYK